jgi:hypothetical protein
MANCTQEAKKKKLKTPLVAGTMILLVILPEDEGESKSYQFNPF